MMSVRRVLATLLVSLLNSARCAAAYSLDDPAADHRAMAIEQDEAGNAVLALRSFRASARFSPASSGAWR